MFELTNKVALVTGARRGMGKADALTLAKQGAKVAVTDINLEECQQVVEEIKANGGEAMAFKMDVSNKAEVDKVFDEVVKKWGRLDILVNNAGVFLPKPFLELTEEDWNKTIDINLKGEFLCAQRAAKEMIKNKWGRIINIASIASGQVGCGYPGGAHYSASKGGITAMTETMALELGRTGITVNVIGPGAIDTPMIQGIKDSKEAMAAISARVPVGRVGRSEEVAAVVVFLASEEASYINGATIFVDGGWLAA
ncbi:MAG: SDR family NAD(P)-dependent oxidoreductase [bacterium]|nr:SDR family NAD(P)-dependent oxidoreductase [bacterium]